MMPHRPWRVLVEKTFTLERHRRMDELGPAHTEVFRLETEVYDKATERMIGRQQDPPRVTFETLTANFTDDQWAEFERLVNQLMAEKGVHELAAAARIEVRPFERPHHE